MKSIHGDQELVDIGHGVGIAFWYRWPRESNPEPGGLIEEHPDQRDPSKRCAGSVSFEGVAQAGRPAWHVVSMEPLTLTPSLVCTACGHHGWITAGKWCPA